MVRIVFHDAEEVEQPAAGTAAERRRGAGMGTVESVSGLEITGARQDRDDEVLTPRALELIALLHRELNPRRLERLDARRERVRALAGGGTLDFLPETARIRDDDSWRVADPAPGLVDRRAEITGPTDRKMTINA